MRYSWLAGKWKLHSRCSTKQNRNIAAGPNDLLAKVVVEGVVVVVVVVVVVKEGVG